ncbi:MAG: hypothetical protein R6V41_02610 [Desulfobacteraceae bacterium]
MSDSENKSPDTRILDLQEKQSVRATFKLSRKAIDSIGLVAVHMGIKQKSLFDYVIEDVSTLKKTAEQIKLKNFKQIPRIQKTYVLSRKTINLIETIAHTHNLPRDALVEHSIRKLESLIQSEKEKHKKRKELFFEVRDHFDRGQELLEEAGQLLGKEDPFSKSLEKAVLNCEKSAREMKSFIDKGNALEEF